LGIQGGNWRGMPKNIVSGGFVMRTKITIKKVEVHEGKNFKLASSKKGKSKNSG